MTDDLDLVTVEEAARIVGKTPHNIRDYIQRGRISKYNERGERIQRAQNGHLRVSLKEIRMFLSLVEQGLEKHHRAGLHPKFLRSPFFSLASAAAAMFVLLLPGCARTPEAASVPQARRRLTVTFTVAGRINPSYYYFVGLDTLGDPAEGPRPVVSSPWGNGWGTGRITHYVQYHGGVFQVYRFREGTNLLVADAIGMPFEAVPPTPPAENRLQVTLDIDATLGTEVSLVNLNVITTPEILIESQFQGTKLYDGLGQSGNHFVSLPLNLSRLFTGLPSPEDPEQAGDLPAQPTPGVNRDDIDLTNVTVEVRIL